MRIKVFLLADHHLQVRHPRQRISRAQGPAGDAPAHSKTEAPPSPCATRSFQLRRSPQHVGMNVAAIVESAIAYGVACRKLKKARPPEKAPKPRRVVAWVVRTSMDAPCRSSSTGLTGLGSAPLS